MASSVTLSAVTVSVAPILKITLDEVYAFIKEQFHMLYGVEEEVQDLDRKLKAINAVLQDAENKQMVNGGVKNWLSELTEAAYNAEDILESWATECKVRKMKQEVSKPFTKAFSPYKFMPMVRWDVAKTIKKISERLGKIENLKAHYQLQEDAVVLGPRARNSSRETGSFINNIDVVGREADRDNIINLLVSDDESTGANQIIIPVIPIVGMGGLGKTTLARQVYNDERIRRHYEVRMWVGVTENFDSTQILKDMISDSELKQNIDSLSKDQLENRLLNSVSGKRFLLVLDDVWTTDYNNEWAPIKRLLNKGRIGSKILVTTRDGKVSNNMGTREPYHLQYLPYDECWILFKILAFKNGTPLDLKEYGEEIVRKCKGLPLAVVQMGALLRLCGIDDTIKWKKIAESELWKLEGEAATRNADADRPKILPFLILSYNHLSPNLKHCFSYCSIFPKAYEFDKTELVKLWMAEKYIPPSSSERVEDIGNQYFDILSERYFFQNSDNDSKRYKMHDLIHDLAQFVSSTHCCQVKDSTASGISETTRHVSFIYEEVEKPLLNLIQNSKELRTLLLAGRNLKSQGKALDKLFHTLRYIRVLDLSSSTLLALPKSIKKLTLLRYLDLSKNEIKNLPNSICTLYNLQTLKLIGCPWLFELPKDFGNLINLRHLELDEMFWYKSYSLPQRLGRLTGLHNLHLFLVSDKSGYEIGQLENMMNLTGTLSISNLEYAKNAGKAMLQDKERLRKLVLKWSNRNLNNVPGDGEADEKALEDLQPHSNVNQLQIYHYWGTKFPDWVRNGQLQNLVSVRLYHCTKCKILSLGVLPHLSELYIKGMQKLKEWTEFSYPSLVRLHISDCPKMKELPSGFPTLRALKIKNCESLKALPAVSQLMFLILVDNLVLDQWNEDVQIVPETNEGETRMTVSASLTNLLELKIINCPAMQTLPQFFFPQKLDLNGCRLLGSLPDPVFTQRLQCLALDTFDDANLVRSIPDSTTLYSLIISNISNITSLPKWPNLPKLQALYIHDCSDLISLSEQDDESWKSLISLRLLSIQNCPQLVTFPLHGFPNQLECLSIGSCSSLKSFGSNDIFKTLIALNDLYIENCPSLLSFPEEGVSTSLQHLSIQGCSSLTKQFWNKDGDWLKIEHILDLEIDIEPVDASPSSSAAQSHTYCGCNGTDVTDIVQPQKLHNPKGSTQRDDKGQNSKGKGVLAEHSGSVEYVAGQDLKGKGILEEPSQSGERGKSSNGKLVIKEPLNDKLMIKEQPAELSASEEHGQSSKEIVAVAESSSSQEHSKSWNGKLVIEEEPSNEKIVMKEPFIGDAMQVKAKDIQDQDVPQVEHVAGQDLKGKGILEEPSQSVERGKNSNGKLVIKEPLNAELTIKGQPAEPSASEEHGQSSKEIVAVAESSSSQEHSKSWNGKLVIEEEPSNEKLVVKELSIEDTMQVNAKDIQDQDLLQVEEQDTQSNVAITRVESSITRDVIFFIIGSISGFAMLYIMIRLYPS